MYSSGSVPIRPPRPAPPNLAGGLHQYLGGADGKHAGRVGKDWAVPAHRRPATPPPPAAFEARLCLQENPPILFRLPFFHLPDLDAEPQGATACPQCRLLAPAQSAPKALPIALS